MGKKYNMKKIVVINRKAEVIGVYESVLECCRVNGFYDSTIYESKRRRRVYKGMLFLEEKDYREYFMRGALDELKFGTIQERRSEKVKNIFQKMTKETNERRKKAISEKAKKDIKQGKRPHVYLWGASHKKMIECVQTGKVYSSLQEAALELGVHHSTVSQSLRKGYKTKGVNFKYV
jgi:hypothetical protein